MLQLLIFTLLTKLNKKSYFLFLRSLKSKYNVTGIPALIVVKKNGAVISTDGRSDVQVIIVLTYVHYCNKIIHVEPFPILISDSVRLAINNGKDVKTSLESIYWASVNLCLRKVDFRRKLIN